MSSNPNITYRQKKKKVEDFTRKEKKAKIEEPEEGILSQSSICVALNQDAFGNLLQQQ
jgi:hypothetical protein